MLDIVFCALVPLRGYKETATAKGWQRWEYAEGVTPLEFGHIAVVHIPSYGFGVQFGRRSRRPHLCLLALCVPDDFGRDEEVLALLPEAAAGVSTASVGFLQHAA